jgi:hypothetical protein
VDQTEVVRSRIEVPPPAYGRSSLPGIEAIDQARSEVARRYFEDDAISEDEYRRRVTELLEQEAVLRRRRDDAVADLDDQLADLHDWFVYARMEPQLAQHVTADQLDRQRARAAHLLRVRRHLLALPAEGERRELYELEESRSIEGLPAEPDRRSLAQISADFVRTKRFHDASVTYVTTLIDEGRSDPELLDAARRALADVRQWQRDQNELQALYDEVRALEAPAEFAVVEPMIERIESAGLAYVELPRRRMLEPLRSRLRSKAADRGVHLKTQVMESKPGIYLLAAAKGKDAELRKLATLLWRTREELPNSVGEGQAP